MKNQLYIFTFIFACLSLIILANIDDKTVTEKRFYAMGTTLSIIIAENKVDDSIFEQAFQEFKKVENVFKDKLDLNNDQVKQLLAQGLELSNETNGVFSVYLGSVIKLWQFDKTNKTITNVPTKEQVKKALDEKQINLYAIAKGFGIDKVAQFLKSKNINNFIVNAGGDLFVSGTNYGKQWNIGINNSSHILACKLDSYAVATSSNLYNYYNFNDKKYGHLLNGVTGWPIPANKSITILAKNATIADALATAVFVDESLVKQKNKYNFATFKQENSKFSVNNLPKECKI